MADKVKETAVKRYKITVSSNPGYCGTDACGIQFSNGCTETDNVRAVSWFKEHKGYTVEEIAVTAGS